ncbi:DEAD/DEAH box helicase [Rubellimicrobium aerolatum]|uniref:DEAD/DEAH box helicase n=1 Tax=Rubellimicrobium aerolatum TaxID=490979 RepID=A0ABW0SCK5_9RHOB|nr:DEAD/DEAH box helicase [Rubellimicrobium aerolatum]MBP1806198.1 ATP-dependent RNA helicase DeaD [Rubellimicrobium aerolatum]
MIQTLLDALAERGYDTMTAVQEAVTQPGLDGSDLLVSAQTGSGKTVAFGLAIGPTLLGEAGALGPAGAPLALVVAPTRELAFQVMRELRWLYAKAGASVVSCVGGMNMSEERRALERGAHIVVGTPGRLRDHIQRGSLELGQIRAIVLDEADEMLDLGFREDLEFMLGQAPEERRTLLFSATVPAAIVKLATQFQRDAVRVATVSATSQHADIAYQAVRVGPNDAENAIINVLRFHDAKTAIVFANTRAMVSRLGARFQNRGLSVVTLSGELSQKERTHALQSLRDGRARVCVATDVAARGIDLPNLELVVHAELPTNVEGLLHRSGRTGRAGRKGTSVLIVPPRMIRKAENLLRIGKIQAEWTVAPSAEEILRRDEERLLSDPVWSEEPSEEEAAFAAKLLAVHSPERIAAAYLRLSRAGTSAPEELGWADAPAEPKVRKPFGPSTWFALSVGADDRAEARWLLPLLLRAGRLDKDAIGAIRVQASESFVEIADDRVEGFLKALDGATEIEEGVGIRRLEGAPDLAAGQTVGQTTGHATGRPAPKKAGHRKGPPRRRDDAEDPRAGAGAEGDAAPRPRKAKPARAEEPMVSVTPRAPARPRAGWDADRPKPKGRGKR